MFAIFLLLRVDFTLLRIWIEIKLTYCLEVDGIASVQYTDLTKIHVHIVQKGRSYLCLFTHSYDKLLFVCSYKVASISSVNFIESRNLVILFEEKR